MTTVATVTGKKDGAKVVRRSSSKKVYSHDVVIGEETLVVKTSCKLFGGIMLENGKIVGDCLKCKENAGIQSLCAIATFPEILEEKKAKKGTAKSSTSVAKKEGNDTVGRIVEFLYSGGNPGRTMKEIKDFTGYKTTLYNICARHPNRIRRDGKLFFAA